MSYQDFVVHLPFAAGILVGAGLFLLIALLALVAFFWRDEE
jgi:hypothetical protein